MQILLHGTVIEVSSATSYTQIAHFRVVRLTFPKELESLIRDRSDIEIPADFIEGEVDHMGLSVAGNAYELVQYD